MQNKYKYITPVMSWFPWLGSSTVHMYTSTNLGNNSNNNNQGLGNKDIIIKTNKRGSVTFNGIFSFVLRRYHGTHRLVVELLILFYVGYAEISEIRNVPV